MFRMQREGGLLGNICSQPRCEHCCKGPVELTGHCGSCQALLALGVKVSFIANPLDSFS